MRFIILKILGLHTKALSDVTPFDKKKSQIKVGAVGGHLRLRNSYALVSKAKPNLPAFYPSRFNLRNPESD